MHTAQLKSAKQRDPSTTLTMVQVLSLKAPAPSLIFIANSSKVSTSPMTSTTHRNISAACSRCTLQATEVPIRSEWATVNPGMRVLGDTVTALMAQWVYSIHVLLCQVNFTTLHAERPL